MIEAREREERPARGAQLHNQTIRPADRSTPQSRGQLAKVAQLEAEADRLQADGAYPAARRARHQANHLRRLAAGPRPEHLLHFVEGVPLLAEKEQALDQLGRWAGRGAA